MMYRARVVTAALALCLTALALQACVPVAESVRDALTVSDGATLDYATGGVLFSPGDRPALSVVIVVRGDDLASTDERCELDGRYLECRLGDVLTDELVNATGKNRLGLATYFRNGEPGTVFTAFTPVQ